MLAPPRREPCTPFGLVTLRDPSGWSRCVIPLGAGHLRHLVAAYARHFNAERPHQAKGNRLLEPTDAANAIGPIQCRKRAGGLLRFYHREAA